MKWVSVKDALPEVEDRVLTTGISIRYIGQKPYRWYEIASINAKGIFHDDEGNALNVLHWASFEPPEGEPALAGED